jgi:integrase
MTEHLASTALVLGRSTADEAYLVTTRDGISFDSREPIWPITAKADVDIGRVRERFDGVLLDGLNATLRTLVSKHAFGTMQGLAHVLLHYHRSMCASGRIRQWNAVDFRNYRAKLIAEFGHEDYLIKLRSFLKHWKALRHPGVSETAWAALRQMRLKSAPTGRAVRTLDAEKGPLSPEEVHQLTQDVYRAAEEGRIDLEDLSLTVFHIITGRRPCQSAALKCKDVDGSRKADPEPGQAEGERLLLLHVPRAKQKGHRFRQTRRSVHLVEVYFALFDAQKSLVHEEMRQMLCSRGFELQEQDLKHLLDELPLYPHWAAVRSTLETAAEQREQSHAIALHTLKVHAESQYWHLDAQGVSNRLQEVCKVSGAQAASGESLALGGARLRYTKGTDLARRGVSLAALAWLMDHSNLDSAGIYIDNLPEHAAELNKALSGSSVLNRVASMFRGELVDSEAAAIGGDDPQRSRIHYKGEGAATCGKRKQCGLGDGIPLACYTCDRFQPWVDGPHQALLTDLQAERRRNAAVLGERHAVTLRREKTIAAVTIVVQRCAARKRELAAQREGPSNE